jgi:hypothetical protein
MGWGTELWRSYRMYAHFEVAIDSKLLVSQTQSYLQDIVYDLFLFMMPLTRLSKRTYEYHITNLKSILQNLSWYFHQLDIQ